MDRGQDKPAGLGGLSRLGQHLQTLSCEARNYGVVLFAGDNGVSREKTSRYDPMDSSSIVISHLIGKSPTALLLNRISRPEIIADFGLYNDVYHPALLEYKICRSSRNFLESDALTPAEVGKALDTAPLLWQRIEADRFDLIGIGEIGIGDTLCAAAIAAVLTNCDPTQMTGYGSAGHKAIGHKVDIINKALNKRCPAKNIIDLLARFGGLEIAGLTGFILEAAAHGKPVMLDGYVTAVAAMLAAMEDNRVVKYIIAPSLSLEKGHKVILDKLGAEPFFRFDFNYGEGFVSSLGLFMAELVSAF
jgi:nicotinate-nucleotide--dimethylbenzimidazole phosphoribosyltransferase